MDIFQVAQGLVQLAIGVAVFATAVWALVNAAKAQSAAFPAAGKQTKTLWVVLTAVGAALAFTSMTSPLSFGGIIGAGVAIYFLVGVLPAVRSASGRGRPQSGYGSW